MGRIMAVMAACLLATGAAEPAAQPVYKCTAAGKVSYGEHPCAHGTASALPAAPAPADADAAAARLARDKARLAQFEQARKAQALAEEREQARGARTAALRREKCERLRLKAKWAAEDAARAPKQAAGTARLKARRQEQALAVECPA